MWEELLRLPWFSDRSAAVGIVITIVGFTFTISQVLKSRRAADQVRLAVNEAIRKLAVVDSIAELSSAIERMEHLKNFHRLQELAGAVAIYPQVRRTLSEVREQTPNLTDDQNIILQAAISVCSEFEAELEKLMLKNEPDIAISSIIKWNKILSSHIDKLRTLSTTLRNRTG